MNSASRFHGRLARLPLFVALLAVGVLVPGSAAAMSPPPSAPPGLSPRLAELAKPGVRSAPRSSQAARLSLAARGPGSLLRDGDRVLVDVRFGAGAATAAPALRASGAEIVQVSPRYQTVTVAARPAALPGIAGLDRVEGVTELLAPLTRAADCGGAVRSEGDTQLNAASARAGF